MASQIPSVGQWYRDMATNQFIEIIAVDEYSSVISIQYENAEIDELDLASWNGMHCPRPVVTARKNAGSYLY